MQDPVPIETTQFFAKVGDATEILMILEHLPEVMFFVKDRNSRLITCNKAMLKMFRRAHVREIIGKTGLDFFPASLASAFLEDDRRVMDDDQAMVDAVELSVAADGTIAWFTTTKIPLHDKAGKVVGLFGTTKRLRSADRRLHPNARIMPVVEYVQINLDRDIEISQLAKLCRLSVSQFHRSFKALFRQTPLQFILRLRIQRACQLLLTGDLNVGEIAEHVGVNDQNYLTRQFKAITGMTPTAYRKKYRAG